VTRGLVIVAAGLIALNGTAAFGPLEEVRVRTDDELRAAVRTAAPGARILIEPGTYRGGLWLENLHGTPGSPIVIEGRSTESPPVFQGGTEALHLVEASHVVLRNLRIRGMTGNGLNIDDGGTSETPAHHITLERIRISDVGPEGNRDGIKLSGVDDFTIRDCTIERWGSGGSGIDMVGCHRGRIEDCTLRQGGSEGVQCKGGTSQVMIQRCRFLDCGHRGVNIGGSTGLAFFRPPVDRMPPGGRCEARDVTVQGCLFVGGQAHVAFVGVDGAVVRACTLYRPGRWAVRILQETREPGFVPCRNGVVEDCIIVFRSDLWAEGGVNIGPATAPQTFRFARNVWRCEDRPDRSAPRLPVAESGGIIGADPLFVDPARGDFRLRPGSSAAGRGHTALLGE